MRELSISLYPTAIVNNYFHLEIFFLQENCPVIPLQMLWRGFLVMPLMKLSLQKLLNGDCLILPLITLVWNWWSPSWTNSKAPATGQRTGTGSFSKEIITLLYQPTHQLSKVIKDYFKELSLQIISGKCGSASSFNIWVELNVVIVWW